MDNNGFVFVAERELAVTIPPVEDQPCSLSESPELRYGNQATHDGAPAHFN